MRGTVCLFGLEVEEFRRYDWRMTPETVFSIVNSIAFFAWIYLLVAARWTPRIFTGLRFGLPAALAVVYLFALTSGEPVEGAGYRTLSGVMALFTSPWAVLGGWIHYLAFDFFVGCWILKKSKEEGISHYWILVPMILTFLFGPVGLMLFLILLLGFRKKRQVQTA
jgi:hypothetical protein